MPGSRTNKVLDGIVVPTQSAVQNFQRSRDETGLVFLSVTGTGINLNCKVQGRPDSSSAWYNLIQLVETDLSGGAAGGTVAVVIALFPQMRLNANIFTGTTPVLDGWLIE